MTLPKDSQKKNMPNICTEILHDHSDLLDLLNRLDKYGVEAAEGTRYSAAEELYNDMIRAVDRCEGIYTLKRAAIRYLGGNHGDALEDIRRVVRSYPDQVNSYLLAGQILLDQGRLQEALKAYHIGCVNVTHHDFKYQELCTAMENLERQIAKEAKQTVLKTQTPKKTLPFDIVSHIFSMVPVSTRVQLAATCKDWRRDLLLSGWSGMWHTIDLDGASIRNKDIVLSNIPGDQVRQVIFAIREKTIMRDTLKDILKYNWNQVETIDITEQLGSQRALQDLMVLNARVLKHIRLCQVASHFDSTNINWLIGIFHLCPNLESFVCDIRTINPHEHFLAIPHPELTIQSPLHIKRLTIMTPSLTRILPRLLHHCPELEQLTINPSLYLRNRHWMDQVLDTLERCQKLSKLSFKTWMDKRDNTASMNSSGVTCTNGLSELCYDVQHTATPQHTLQRLINKYGSTLDSFRWSSHGTNIWYNEDDHARLSDAFSLVLLSLGRSTHLSHLHLALDHGYIHTVKQPPLLFSAVQLASLFEPLQALQVVYLRSANVNHHLVFEALASLEQLRHLDIGTIHWRECSIQGIKHLFKHSRSLLHVNVKGEVDDKILCATQYSNTLQRLSLGNHPHCISSKGLKRFAEPMHRESKLTYLSLNASTRYMKFQDLMPLTRLEILCKLELYDYDITTQDPGSPSSINFEPIFEFIKSSRNGAMLTVIVNTGANYYTITMVKSTTNDQQQFRVVSHRLFSTRSSTEYYSMS